jgi:hypothetical protein
MRNEDSRITRCRVWFDANKPDPKTKGEDAEDDYTNLQAYRDVDAESANNYDEVKLKSIFGEWIHTDGDAQWLATHYFVKYRDGTPRVMLSMELKDDDIRVMDLVELTLPEDVDVDGNEVSRFYYVISKVKRGINLIELELEQAGFAQENYARIGHKNGVLDVGINTVTTQIDVDLSATGLTIDDWRTGGTHHIYIEDEKISYTTVTDQGSDIIRLTGGARGVDGTSNVAHSAGVDVRMLYSAASDEYRRIYGFIGSTGDPPSGNLLDGNGDLVNETPGYLFW